MNREDLKGITVRKCPAACTAEHCIISTVAVCKHPFLVSDAGCGPITIANREIAKKVVKLAQIEGGDDAVDAATVREPAQQKAKGRGSKKGRVNGKRHAASRRAGRRGNRDGEQAREQDAGQARQEEGLSQGEADQQGD